MRAKEYLRELATVEQNIEQLEREIRQLEARLTSCTANYGEHIGGNSETREEGITQLIDAKQAFMDGICQAMRERHKIITEIQGVGDATASAILYKRYVERKPLRAVAYELHYTYDYIRKLHGHALQLFDSRILRGHKMAQNKC